MKILTHWSLRLMKPFALLSLLCLAATTVSNAQSSSQSDTLGAHLNSGRGCGACHAPASPDFRKNSGITGALWGEEIPANAASDDDTRSPEPDGLLICLSCHDGNYAPKAMMKNTIYEAIPFETYGTIDPIPTFVDKPGTDFGPDISQHPVGRGAETGCGGAIDWDCGPKAAKFAANYGFFLQPHTYKGKTIVVCTTCHNPHSMDVTSVTKEAQSHLYHAGIYATRYFLRAPYGSDNVSKTSNESSQYCRQCHADMSNEMNGSGIGTTM